MSAAAGLPLVIRLGHYYFDNKPLIGKMADVNVWSRFLSEEELRRFSRCDRAEARRGDLVNQDTADWNITGSLITASTVDEDEVLGRPFLVPFTNL